jgi:subtilase family serine protease
MNADDFKRATVTISYNDNELVGMDEPYSVYKYLPSSDSYVALTTDVDSVAKTLTVTLNSVDDPILAVGGLAAAPLADTTTVWVVVVVAVVAIVIIVVLAVLLVIRNRRM